MAENDNPIGNVSPAEASEAENIAAIGDLLDEPEDLENDDAEDLDAEPDEDADDLEADDEGEDEAEADSDVDADEDGTADAGDGRFVPKSGRVTMPDGSTITVQEAINGYMAQSDYSRKTAETSRMREQLETQTSEISQVRTELAARQQLLEAAVERLKPRRPEDMDDIVALTRYQADMETWREWEGLVENQRSESQTEDQRLAQLQEQTYLQNEMHQLHSVMPEMADRNRHDKFLKDVARVMDRYGYKSEEVYSIRDHRLYPLLRDFIKLRAASQKAVAVKEEVAKKPKMVRSSKRVEASSSSKRRKQKNFERLQNEGSLSAGIGSLMDLDL